MGAMTIPRYNLTKKRLKKMPDGLIEDVEAEIKALLHAHRDCLRNQDRDTVAISFDCRDGYYGEAFGILRALHLMGYGYFGPSNMDAIKDAYPTVYNVTQPKQNLKWWFSRLEREVLEEEGFGGDHRCVHCLEKYKKDDAYILEKKAQYDDARARERGLPRADG